MKRIARTLLALSVVVAAAAALAREGGAPSARPPTTAAVVACPFLRMHAAVIVRDPACPYLRSHGGRIAPPTFRAPGFRVLTASAHAGPGTGAVAGS